MNNVTHVRYFLPVLVVTLLTSAVLLPQFTYGESLQSKIEKGDKLYKDELYDEAMKSFVDAQIESPEESKLKYNIANTHYKMNNYEEAIRNYHCLLYTSDAADDTSEV